MVVDDDESVRSVIQILLDTAGYETLVVASGAECLQRVAAEQPDIVLLDVKMPDLDGFAVAERLAADENTRAIPIVMVSGALMQQTACGPCGPGAVEFLSKPPDMMS